MTHEHEVKLGDRVRLLAEMRNMPGELIPVEEGMPIGLEGTVDWIGTMGQIGVKWDNNRRLMLLENRDDFEIIVDPRLKQFDAYVTSEFEPEVAARVMATMRDILRERAS